ncbi:IS3 family transposase [Sporosarcina jiandibaonis]|uniref:IS3 family transposase n=1 Tax=Sporosarcina jiandibaonis TaxID=2715535 RepID=UPI0031B5E438
MIIGSYFSYLKTEFPHLFPVDSAGQVIDDLANFITYFNEERSQKRLGYLMPTPYLKTEGMVR